MINKYQFAIIYAIILLIASGLRLWRLGEIPIDTYWDETAMIMDGQAVVATGNDVHGKNWLQPIFASYGDYKLPVYIWLVTIAVKLVGPTAFAVRLPSAVAGILTVILTGLIAQELFKHLLSARHRQNLQLWAMLIVSIAPWSITFSRVGFEGHLGQLLVGSTFYLALKARKQARCFLIAATLAITAVFSYFSTRFVLPIGYFMSFFYTLQTKVKKAAVGYYLLGGAVFVAGLIVMSLSPLYPASQQFRLSSPSILDQSPAVQLANTYRQLSNNSPIDRIFFHRYFFTLKRLLINYSKNLDLNFLFWTGESNLRHSTGEHGLFYLSFLPLLIYGLYQLAQKRQVFIILYLLSWWLFGLLPASVPLEVPHALRSLNSLIPIAILIAYGGEALFNQNILRRNLLSAIFGCCLIWESTGFIHYYFQIYPHTSASAFQAGYTQLASALLAEKSSANQVWVDIDDNRFYLWLLANSYYPPQLIQSWPKNQNFQLSQVDNISWQNINYSDVPSVDGKLIIAGRRNQVLSRLADYGYTPNRITSVYDKLGEEQFVLTYFDRSVQ